MIDEFEDRLLPLLGWGVRRQPPPDAEMGLGALCLRDQGIGGFLQVLSQFSFEAIWGMLSPCNLGCKGRESDDGGELQGGPFPARDHSHGRAVVRGVSAEHTPCRRTHGGTWGQGGSLHD